MHLMRRKKPPPSPSPRRCPDAAVARRTEGAPPSPRFSVVIPAYNEERRLESSLTEIRRYLRADGRSAEVILVDDGSHDGTASLGGELARDWPELRVIRHAINQGKGAAVRSGMLAARGDLRLFTDADLSTPIAELSRLEATIVRGADIAIASRALPDSHVELHQPWYRETMGRTYNALVRRLVLGDFADTQCGFKLFTGPAAEIVFRQMECPRFGFDAEVLLRARRAGMRVAEVGVVWRNVEGSRVAPIRDGARMFWDLWRVRRIGSRR